MNLRHAAALALVGWYLLMPPVSRSSSGKLASDLTIVAMMSATAEGDSGSLVVTVNANNPVGMVFGTDVGGEALIMPIAKMVKDTGISAFTQTGTAGAIPVGSLDPAQQATETEEAAAQATVKRNTWILKLHHVRSMGINPTIDSYQIIVTIDSEKHLDEVESELPSQLDGFPVRVILYDNHPIFF
jgi:hypothetical protein